MVKDIYGKREYLLLSLIIIFSLILLPRCRNTENRKERVNDTTAVLQILLDSAFYNNRLPNSAALKKPYPFADTIIFKFDSLLHKHLPTHLKYKLLTEAELCSVITIYQNNPNGFRYFLELTTFEKTDTAYHAVLESHCLYSDNTKSKCEYEKYCNGGIGMTFKRRTQKLEGDSPIFWEY